MTSEQTFSDIGTPEFMLDENIRLLGQDGHRVNDLAVGETSEPGELLYVDYYSPD